MIIFIYGTVDLSKYRRLLDRFLRKPIEARPCSPDGFGYVQSCLASFAFPILGPHKQRKYFSSEGLNHTLIDKVQLAKNTTEMIFDLDSLHSDTYGKQKKTDYYAYYQTNGYHPLVAFDGLTGDFLKAELRSGNVYTSNGIGAFIEPLFENYNQVVPITNILFGSQLQNFTTSAKLMTVSL